MLLFTPLDQDGATRAIAGLGFPDGEVYFLDLPGLDEATSDAVWVVIEAPEADIIAFECDFHPELGYREFALPGPVASRYPTRPAFPH